MTSELSFVVGVVIAVVAMVIVVALIGWAYDPGGDEPVGPVTTISPTR